MNLTEFFESIEVGLPKNGFEENKEPFDEYLSGIFKEYFACVSGIDDADSPSICSGVNNSIDKIEKLYKQIVLAVKQHLDGFPNDSYVTFVKALSAIDAELNRLITDLSQFDPSINQTGYSDIDLRCTLHPPLYRMRSDRAVASTGSLSRKDIFHIPFEKRRLVSNQRYSVTGLPCLYLGSSIWICWDELGHPDLNNVFVSRFRFAEKVRVLDFQLPPRAMWELFKYVQSQSKLNLLTPSEKRSVPEVLCRYNEQVITAYIVCWPLIAACSIRVDSEAGPFFPEYIIPQLLLQWVTKDPEVDGIRYFSTRSLLQDYYINANCVFPAREIQPKGYCSHLKKKFHLTTPISWEILQMLNLPNRFQSGPSNWKAKVKLNNDLPSLYSVTGFYLAEGMLGEIEGNGITPSWSGPVED
jgi:hypothetical protein